MSTAAAPIATRRPRGGVQNRGYDFRHRRQDVHDSRACYCVRRFGIGYLWFYLLDNYLVLMGEHSSPLRILSYITVGAIFDRP